MTASSLLTVTAALTEPTRRATEIAERMLVKATILKDFEIEVLNGEVQKCLKLEESIVG